MSGGSYHYGLWLNGMTGAMPTQLRITQTYAAPSVIERGFRGYRVLSSIRFLCPQIGWAIGEGQILQTTSGGHSWKNCYHAQFLEGQFGPEIVFPVSARQCWLVGYERSNATLCLHTADFGKTWGKQLIVENSSPLGGFFSASGNGWIVVKTSKGLQLRLFRTDDRGKTWRSFDLCVSGRPSRISFRDERYGWLMTTPSMPRPKSKSRLYVTEDGGITWRKSIEMTAKLFDFYQSAQAGLFLLGEKGLLLHARSERDFWKRIKTTTRLSLYDIDCRGRIFVAVGTSNHITSSRHTVFLFSTDAGETWMRLPISVATAFFGVYLTTWKGGVLAASDGIYRFTLG